MTPTTEKIFTEVRPEFGTDAGKIGIIVRALYGTKSAGASFQNNLADRIRNLGYHPCKADPNVWMKPFTKPQGRTYYTAMSYNTLMIPCTSITMQTPSFISLTTTSK